MAVSAPFIALLALLPRAFGHGWLAEPPARNARSGPPNGYCPHCGNGAGVCGDGGQWPGGSNYLGKNEGPQRTFSAGEVVEFTVTITAHHRGHFELHICDQPIGPQTPNPDGCLSKWALERVPPEQVHSDCRVNDPRDDCQPLDIYHPERWYLSPGTGQKKMHFRIPQGLQCTSCTLQWRWWTANSCIPAGGYGCYFSRMAALGWDKAAWCGVFCGSDSCPGSLLQSNTSHAALSSTERGCGEEFRNCADIAVTSSGAPMPTMPPAPVPATPMPTAAPTPRPSVPMPSTSRAPSPAPVPGSVDPRCQNCQGASPCIWSDGKCYPRVAKGACLAGAQNVWCGAAEPEPEPEAEPEPEPEVATPAPAPQGCKARPGNNGGATDFYCAKCANGYRWWPCNNAALCEGAACKMSLAQMHKKVSPHRGFLASALLQARAALGRVVDLGVEL